MLGGSLVDIWRILCDEERCCFLYVLLLHVVLFFLFALRSQQLYSRSFKTGTWRFQQLYSRYGKNWPLVVSPFACGSGHNYRQTQSAARVPPLSAVTL